MNEQNKRKVFNYEKKIGQILAKKSVAVLKLDKVPICMMYYLDRNLYLLFDFIIDYNTFTIDDDGMIDFDNITGTVRCRDSNLDFLIERKHKLECWLKKIEGVVFSDIE